MTRLSGRFYNRFDEHLAALSGQIPPSYLGVAYHWVEQQPAEALRTPELAAELFRVEYGTYLEWRENGRPGLAEYRAAGEAERARPLPAAERDDEPEPLPEAAR